MKFILLSSKYWVSYLLDIEYIKQKRFEKCRNKLPLPFDFYLPNENICIEYDGIQHFKPIDYFGGVLYGN